MNIDEHITRDPKICGGQPVLRGTRVPVRTILDSLADGDTVDCIQAEFPTVSIEQIEAAKAFAAASQCSIRPACAEDLPVLRGLIAQLGYAISAEELADNFAVLRASPRDAVLVAEVGQAVVGLATVHVIPELHRRPLARLTAMVVCEAQRGKGIGRALVVAAEAFAHTRGAPRIEVTSRDYREDAHRFYEKLGYRCDERRFLKDLAPE